LILLLLLVDVHSELCHWWLGWLGDRKGLWHVKNFALAIHKVLCRPMGTCINLELSVE